MRIPAMTNVPATTDVLQEDGILGTPEIRVWYHPEEIGQLGDDYFQTFETFPEALRSIRDSKTAEDHPLWAFGGYELNLWEIEPVLVNERAILETAKKLADCNVLMDSTGVARVYLGPEFFDELINALTAAGANMAVWKRAQANLRVVESPDEGKE